jgi:hypothetical protein
MGRCRGEPRSPTRGLLHGPEPADPDRVQVGRRLPGVESTTDRRIDPSARRNASVAPRRTRQKPLVARARSRRRDGQSDEHPSTDHPAPTSSATPTNPSPEEDDLPRHDHRRHVADAPVRAAATNPQGACCQRRAGPSPDGPSHPLEPNAPAGHRRRSDARGDQTHCRRATTGAHLMNSDDHGHVRSCRHQCAHGHPPSRQDVRVPETCEDDHPWRPEAHHLCGRGVDEHPHAAASGGHFERPRGRHDRTGRHHPSRMPDGVNGNGVARDVPRNGHHHRSLHHPNRRPGGVNGNGVAPDVLTSLAPAERRIAPVAPTDGRAHRRQIRSTAPVGGWDRLTRCQMGVQEGSSRLHATARTTRR